jgi:hypothetical protein
MPSASSCKASRTAAKKNAMAKAAAVIDRFNKPQAARVVLM